MIHFSYRIWLPLKRNRGRHVLPLVTVSLSGFRMSRSAAKAFARHHSFNQKLVYVIQLLLNLLKAFLGLLFSSLNIGSRSSFSCSNLVSSC